MTNRDNPATTPSKPSPVWNNVGKIPNAVINTPSVHPQLAMASLKLQPPIEDFNSAGADVGLTHLKKRHEKVSSYRKEAQGRPMPLSMEWPYMYVSSEWWSLGDNGDYMRLGRVMEKRSKS